MGVLLPRQGASHFGAHNVQDALSNPWAKCMARAYCKWPVIIGIIIASVVVISIIICCVRCLCCGLSCLPCFRGRGRKRARYADAPSAFNPGPYQGYQPANSPHGYAPPQFAQFDTGKNRNTEGGKVNEDSLPAMPSWENGRDRKVLDDAHEDDVEMAKLDPQKAPMLAHQAPAPGATAGYSDMGPPSTGIPYQQHSAAQGGDLGNPYGQVSPGYGGAYGQGSPNGPQQYHSLGDPTAHHSPPAPQAYSAYEPSSAYGAQETGTVYPSPSPYGHYTPNVLQAGRQPASNTFRDV